ncbi:MAG: hypothetical protein PVG93_00195 [Phycisphaerales bacterium]|jgi:hypothetical protein
MVKFSSDVDILKYEPAFFGELYLPSQILIEGTGGTMSGTTFTATGADFVQANVSAGGVVYLHSSDESLVGTFEIVSVDSATELTVSVIRADSQDEPVPPPAASYVYFRVSTFEPQACEVAFALTEYFGIKPGNPSSDIEVGDILDVTVLEQVSVFAIISAVYATLASDEENEHFWNKSRHYRTCFGHARSRARLSIDADSDGIAEQMNTGGSVRLIRD